MYNFPTDWILTRVFSDDNGVRYTNKVCVSPMHIERIETYPYESLIDENGTELCYLYLKGDDCIIVEGSFESLVKRKDKYQRNALIYKFN